MQYITGRSTTILSSQTSKTKDEYKPEQA